MSFLKILIFFSILPFFQGNKVVNTSEIINGIRFEKDITFGDSEDVLLGRISDISVDSLNRVFIGDILQHTIHVFNSDGTYQTSIGREGEGPGEFNQVSQIKIHSNKLLAGNDYNTFLRNIHAFSLDDFSYSHTTNIIAENRWEFEELNEYYPRYFFPKNDDTFLVGYNRGPFHINQNKRFIRYYLQDKNGRIIKNQIFEQEDRKYLTYTERDRYGNNYTRALSFPFHSRPLFIVGNDSHLYTTKTENFEIQVRQSDGKIVREIHYPFEHKEFRLEEVLSGSDSMSDLILRNTPSSLLPEHWPAIYSMIVDDENHLWVATFVEDVSVHEWWILNDDGEIITTFTWPREKEVELVNNGYLYTRETDDMGLVSIVRYRIDMKGI